MRIEVLEVGVLRANCYIVVDDDVAVVIDPGGEGQRIADRARVLGVRVKCIVNTHGHVDHIYGNTALKCRTGADILIGALDAAMLTDPRLSLAGYIDQTGGSPPADRLLADGDEITAGRLLFSVLHTPGHTEGGLCLLCGDHLFSGDTLFLQSVGRTDLPGGDMPSLMKSIREKLFRLPPKTVVHLGHGQPTTIDFEMKTNPFCGTSV